MALQILYTGNIHGTKKKTVSFDNVPCVDEFTMVYLHLETPEPSKHVWDKIQGVTVQFTSIAGTSAAASGETKSVHYDKTMISVFLYLQSLQVLTDKFVGTFLLPLPSYWFQRPKDQAMLSGNECTVHIKFNDGDLKLDAAQLKMVKTPQVVDSGSIFTASRVYHEFKAPAPVKSNEDKSISTAIVPLVGMMKFTVPDRCNVHQLVLYPENLNNSICFLMDKCIVHAVPRGAGGPIELGTYTNFDLSTLDRVHAGLCDTSTAVSSKAPLWTVTLCNWKLEGSMKQSSKRQESLSERLSKVTSELQVIVQVKFLSDKQATVKSEDTLQYKINGFLICSPCEASEDVL